MIMALAILGGWLLASVLLGAICAGIHSHARDRYALATPKPANDCLTCGPTPYAMDPGGVHCVMCGPWVRRVRADYAKRATA